MSRVFFDDLPIDKVDLKTVVKRLKNLALDNKEKMKTVACLNVNDLNWTYRDKQHRSFVKQADLVISDGWGIVWAGNFLGYQLKERVTTMDYFNRFCRMLEKEGFSVYFLATKQDILQKAVLVLKKRYPKLQIAGFREGFFSQKKERDVIKDINQKKPDFLLAGMGTPKQERWLYKNRTKLKARVGWGVGAVFDYLAGVKKRCPAWMGRLGLEWLFRFYHEPRRLWKRYSLGSVEFLFRTLQVKIKKGYIGEN